MGTDLAETILNSDRTINSCNIIKKGMISSRIWIKYDLLYQNGQFDRGKQNNDITHGYMIQLETGPETIAKNRMGKLFSKKRIGWEKELCEANTHFLYLHRLEVGAIACPFQS
jgi:hypothetical protein